MDERLDWPKGGVDRWSSKKALKGCEKNYGTNAHFYANIVPGKSKPHVGGIKTTSHT